MLRSCIKFNILFALFWKIVVSSSVLWYFHKNDDSMFQLGIERVYWKIVNLHGVRIAAGLPTTFSCQVCGLNTRSRQSSYAAGLDLKYCRVYFRVDVLRAVFSKPLAILKHRNYTLSKSGFDVFGWVDELFLSDRSNSLGLLFFSKSSTRTSLPMCTFKVTPNFI